ncbi:hypothetical protein KCU61_g817, partial [Aureobasidium melanogenum]
MFLVSFLCCNSGARAHKNDLLVKCTRGRLSRMSTPYIGCSRVCLSVLRYPSLLFSPSAVFTQYPTVTVVIGNGLFSSSNILGYRTSGYLHPPVSVAVPNDRWVRVAVRWVVASSYGFGSCSRLYQEVGSSACVTRQVITESWALHITVVSRKNPPLERVSSWCVTPTPLNKQASLRHFRGL